MTPREKLNKAERLIAEAMKEIATETGASDVTLDVAYTHEIGEPAPCVLLSVNVTNKF